MYGCFDPFRNRIWNIDEIPFWYRQNIVTFVSRVAIDKFTKVSEQPFNGMNIVHPAQLQHVINHYQNRLAEVHSKHKNNIKFAKAEVWEKIKKAKT